MAYTKPSSPITYYGGKTTMLPYIRPMIPPHDTYTETFFGGGTVFFDKQPVRNETINEYRVLKLNFKALKPLINATLISRTIYEEAGNYLRAHTHGIEVDRTKLAWAFWMHK